MPTGAALIATMRHADRRHRRGDGAGAWCGDPGVGVVVRAEGRQNRVGPGDRRTQHLRVGVSQVGGDDPRGPVREDAGEPGGVADHYGDVVPGVLGLAEQLAAHPAGGRDDRELHDVLHLSQIGSTPARSALWMRIVVAVISAASSMIPRPP